MDWSTEGTVFGNPAAVLRDGDKVVLKVYLSPDHQSIRIVLPEFSESKQVTFKPGGIIELRRKL